jgi:phosphate transport system permease protein
LTDSSSPNFFSRKRYGDPTFRAIVTAFAAAIVGLAVLLFYELLLGSYPALVRFGFSFLINSSWDPSRNIFGALPMIYGTIVTSVIALLIGVPVSIGVAIFLSEVAPGRISGGLSFVVELLAAVPSVVYGIWGLLILAPFLRDNVYPRLQATLGFLPIFQGTIYGVSILTAGIILAIMITPIISAVSRDALMAVPMSQREAAYALGATRFETIRIAVLRYARSGVIGAIFLGFGRAFGETIAVVMVIGNSPYISKSLFAPGYTLASLIANEFAEALTPTYTAALVEIGLVLFIIAFMINAMATVLLRSIRGESGARGE